MVWCKANRLQQYIKILKEITVKVKGLGILKAIKLAVQGVEAKLKILTEEDI